MSQDIEKTSVLMRIPTDIINSIDKIGSISERDRSWIIIRALRLYIRGEGTDILREGEAIEALNRGEGIPVDQVMKRMTSIIAPDASVETE